MNNSTRKTWPNNNRRWKDDRNSLIKTWEIIKAIFWIMVAFALIAINHPRVQQLISNFVEASKTPHV